MSEKELLYIEDSLNHMIAINDFLKNYIIGLEDDNFKKVLEDLEEKNKDVYKKFYKLIGE